MRTPRSAYFLAGDLWFCIEEDIHARKASLPEYTHIAFSVDEADFENVQAKLIDYGVSRFKENKSEGRSFYFLDPDGHKLEIHVGDWKSRVEAYKKRSDLTAYEFFE